MNKKYKTLLIIILFIIMILGITFFIYYNKDLKYQSVVTIKIGEELPSIENYVDDRELKRLNNKEIEWQDVNLEDNKIYIAGKYIGYIMFKNKKIEITLEVIDDEKPTVEGVKDITIYTNEEVDLLENITISDNSHSETTLNIVGEYNTSVTGEYALFYVATDKSGNETKKEFKLIVKEKEISKQNANISD